MKCIDGDGARDASVSASLKDVAELEGREGIVEGSGLAGTDAPELVALSFLRHNFLILFMDTMFELLFTFRDCCSSATESTENRLEGVFESRPEDEVACTCFPSEVVRSGGNSMLLEAWASVDEGNLPNGSGESGNRGESIDSGCLRVSDGCNLGTSV